MIPTAQIIAIATYGVCQTSWRREYLAWSTPLRLFAKSVRVNWRICVSIVPIVERSTAMIARYHHSFQRSFSARANMTFVL